MTKLELLIDRLAAARRWTSSLLADIPEANWFDMPAPSTTHVAWQVGHLAVSQAALIHGRCFGRGIPDCVPAGFPQAFGRGSTPVPDAARQPTIAEIRATFERLHAEAMDLIAGLSESDLAQPAGTEPHPMFTTKEGAIAMAFMHETFHAGQIALLRRLAGQPALR